VTLPTEKVRDPVNQVVIFCAAGVLSASPLTYFMCRDDSDLEVFCFSEPEDAEDPTQSRGTVVMAPKSTKSTSVDQVLLCQALRWRAVARDGHSAVTLKLSDRSGIEG
jgi:hypothetical protein